MQSVTLKWTPAQLQQMFWTARFVPCDNEFAIAACRMIRRFQYGALGNPHPETRTVEETEDENRLLALRDSLPSTRISPELPLACSEDTLCSYLREFSFRPKQEGLATIPDAAMTILWSFIRNFTDAVNLSRTARSFRRSYETDCDSHLHLVLKRTGRFFPDRKCPNVDQEKVRSIHFEHTDAVHDPKRPWMTNNDIIFPLAMEYAMEELTLKTNSGSLTYGSRIPYLKKLDLRCYEEVVHHRLGEMFPRLETLELTCWPKVDNPNRNAVFLTSTFPKVTRLVLGGSSFHFYISSKTFPMLKDLELWDTKHGSVFHFEDCTLETASITDQQSNRVMGNAHINKLTVPWTDFNNNGLFRSVQVDDLTIEGVFSSHFFPYLETAIPKTVHVRMNMASLDGLVMYMRRFARGAGVAAWDLLDIDVFGGLPAAGGGGYNTSGFLTVSTTMLRKLPKKITLRRSEGMLPPFPLPGYTEARDYSETVDQAEDIILNLSIPVACFASLQQEGNRRHVKRIFG
jgi:hypothetical protein